MVCNGGLVTGLKREKLIDILEKITDKFHVIMPPGKSYSFIKLEDDKTALDVYNKIHGKLNDTTGGILYLTFSKSSKLNFHFALSFLFFFNLKNSVPDFENFAQELPPGLRLILDFVTLEEESKILDKLNWHEEENSGQLKHRKVQHFGYKFRYDTNRVDIDKPIAPIPQEFTFLANLFKNNDCGDFVYNQLTVNHYEPGQGIPPHIDTHSVFEDPILSLSLGSTCVMDFRRDEKRISLTLPARSLLVMSGETRYAWTHGICPRHNDVIIDKNGTTTRERNTRVSLTFRKVRTGNCQCNYPEYCDTKKHLTKEIDGSIAPGLENSYVHEVYEEIAGHFSETRHQQWPNVASFLDEIKTGGIVLDVGCGNGKYLSEKSGIFKVI